MIVKIITSALILIALLALNAVFPQFLEGAPNFLLLLVIFQSFKSRGSDFIWIAFFSGLLLDIYSPFYFGSHTISFLCLAIMIHYLTSTFLTSDPSVRLTAIIILAAFIMFTAMVYTLNIAIFKIVGSGYILSLNYLKGKFWVDLLFNLVFAGPIFFLTELADRIVLKFERKKINPF